MVLSNLRGSESVRTKCAAFVLFLFIAVGADQALGWIDASQRLRNFIAGASVLVALVVAAQIIASCDD